MVKKKKDEEVEGTVEAAAEETVVEAAAVEEVAAAEAEAVEAAPEAEVEAAPAEEPAAEVEVAPAEEAAVEAAPVVEAKPKKAAAKAPKAAKVAKTPTAAEVDGEKKVHKRAERVGIVSSDKMTKTVTVRVDRLVKHPVYRKYVKKRKKFMAHDELGAKIGDKVRIMETRPLSARKRWRVVEILQKAEL
ncbi:MAG: 30S ribosomal protein S17 [Acidobacteria bacterium]|nr:30S ribosomal protein S17 [Acidobacteriota bacterium]